MQATLDGQPVMAVVSDGRAPLTFEVIAAEFGRVHRQAVRKAKRLNQGGLDVKRQDDPPDERAPPPIGEGGADPARDDNQPTIELRIGETERAVDELESLLIASKRGLYQRGGLIVSTGFAKMQTWDGKTVVSQTIEERGDYALLERAAQPDAAQGEEA